MWIFLIGAIAGIVSTCSVVEKTAVTGQPAIPTGGGVLSDFGQIVRDMRSLALIGIAGLLVWFLIPLFVRK